MRTLSTEPRVSTGSMRSRHTGLSRLCTRDTKSSWAGCSTSPVKRTSLAPYLRNVDVQWDCVNTDDLPEMDFPPSARPRYRLRTDDLLVCEGGEVGRTAMWRGELPECYYQKAVHRLRRRCPDDSPRYLYYVMHAAASQGAFRAQSSLNTIDHLTAEKLRRHRFPFPSPSEQHAAADFLDHATEKIDALVAKKQRLIELLQEKRTVLISRAVTKGLDPDAPMKDSGIEWLGDIPSHWDPQPLARCLRRITYGFTNPMPSVNDGPYMLTANDIGDGEIQWDSAGAQHAKPSPRS